MSMKHIPSIEEVLRDSAKILGNTSASRTYLSEMPGFLGAGYYSAVFKVVVKVAGVPALRAIKINYRKDSCWKWLQFCHDAHKKYKGQPAKLAHLPEVFSLEWREFRNSDGDWIRLYHALMPLYSSVRRSEVGDRLSATSTTWEKKFEKASGIPWMHTDIHSGNWMMCPRRGLMLTDPIMVCEEDVKVRLPLFAGRRDLRRRRSFSSAFAV